MSISFDGVGQVAATFLMEDDVKPGMAVTLTGNGTVGVGNADDLPCGLALSVEGDGIGAVQVGGLMTVRYSGGAAPEVGYNLIACDGSGGVKVAQSGGLSCLTVSVDSDRETAVIML